MTSALSKRLERLEALMAARSSGPLRFVELWYGETLEETVAKKVAAGELPENCRVQGVETWRSRRKDHGHLPPTPRVPAPPAPPEPKLLPAPVKTEASPERIPISSHHRTRGSDLGLRISCAWRCRVRTRAGQVQQAYPISQEVLAVRALWRSGYAGTDSQTPRYALR